MKKKILMIILAGILLFVALIVIGLCCLYAVVGDNIRDILKDCWDWYKTLFYI